MIRSSSRRAFMRGLGVGAVALPFVRSAWGLDTAVTKKRLIVFATRNGTVMKDFWPATADGPYSPILKPLEPFRAKINVIRGLNMETAYKTPIPKDHVPDNANMLTARQPSLTGSMGGISVDQHVANVVGRQTKFPSMQLGIAYPISSRGVGQGLRSEYYPQLAFNRLFRDVTADPADLVRFKAQRKSMLDVLNAELKDVRCALGVDERPKFDAHIESLRDLERSFDVQIGVDCKAPVLGPAPSDGAADVPVRLKQWLDLTAAAVACDITRVVTITNGSWVSYPWLGIEGTHHGISHGSEGVSAPQAQREQWLTQIENWTAQQFASMVGKLDAIPEGGGTLLDNCCVLWGHEQSHGGTHSRRDMPWIMAGSNGGAFKTGQVLNFMGKAHNGLLISLANGMGVPTTEFGDPAFSNGPLAEL